MTASLFSRRWPWLLVALVGVVALVGWLVFGRAEAGDTPSGCSGESVRLEINSSTEKDGILAELAERYNKAGRDIGGGRCATVSVHRTLSGAAKDALADGWDPEKTQAPEPQVWMPSSSLWVDLLKQRSSETDRKLTPDNKVPSVAQSPLVIAMPRQMAQQLGWPDAKIGWRDVLTLARDPNGWGSKGRPEWGRFVLGRDNPHISTSGLAATIAYYYAASGVSDDLTLENLADPKVRDFVHGLESSTLHYGPDVQQFLTTLAEADAQGKALSYLSAIVMQEQLIYLYNEGNPTGDRTKFGTSRKPTEQLVAIHPYDGTIMLDHPFVVLSSASDAQRAAASDVLEFLLAGEQQRLFTDRGFRDHTGVRGSVLDGVVPTGDQLSQVSPPSAEVLGKAVNDWDTLRKKANVLLVMDVSGSMDQATGTGTNRLEAAKKAAAQGLGLLSGEDQVALWTFSSESANDSGPYTERVPLGRVSDNRQRLTAALDAMKPKGGTALYSTTRAAQRYMLGRQQDDRINAIVLLTDGENSYPKDNDIDALLRDIDASTQDPSIRVFSIAFTDESDFDVLSRISKASRAAAYDARDPANIDQVFSLVFSNF